MQVHVLSMPLLITKKVTTVGAMKYEKNFNFKTLQQFTFYNGITIYCI